MIAFIRIVTLLLITCSVYSQNSNPKKSEVRKLFKESILQNDTNVITTVSNPWLTDNKDSLFFKADTIRLINPDYRYRHGLCEVVAWTFYRKDKFSQDLGQICKEPPAYRVSKEDSRHSIDLRNTESGVVMITTNAEGVINKYLVIKIERSKDMDEMTLLRLEL